MQETQAAEVMCNKSEYLSTTSEKAEREGGREGVIRRLVPGVMVIGGVKKQAGKQAAGRLISGRYTSKCRH